MKSLIESNLLMPLPNHPLSIIEAVGQATDLAKPRTRAKSPSWFDS
ncbi:Uncharacterised protein [Legionella sainthelensi]|nr:Uncharacterised protein [Legionella sainthelensi]